MKKYDSIDLAKFIASIFVLAIHSAPFENIFPLGEIYISQGLSRLAVPFFFVASAFFFYGKEVNIGNTKKYCKRMLTLYAAWFIVSFPKTIFDRIICSKYSTAKAIILFVRSFFVTSTFSGSWFIVSCVFCAILFTLLERLSEPYRKLITVLISAVVYFWCVLVSGYGNLMFHNGIPKFYNIYELLFADPYTSFITGVPYFAIGRFIAKTDYSVLKKRKNLNLLLSFVFVLLLLAEVYVINRFNLSMATDCYALLLPSIYFIFSFILACDISLKNAKKLRIYSTVIFFSQFLLLFVCEFAEWFFKITIPSQFKFLFALSMGLIISEIILILGNKKGFHWLKYFY